MKITMIKEEYNKVNGKWQLQEETKEEVTREFYENIVNHRWLGDRMYRDYTPMGYVVNKVISTEPTYKLDRTIRRFKFEA